MLQAQRLEVLLADEQQAAVGDGLCRGWIVAAVEHWQLGDRAARPVDGQHLLASAGRTLEDAHVARFDDVESGARLGLRKDQFSGTESALHDAGGEKREFLLAEAGEERDTLKDGSRR